MADRDAINQLMADYAWYTDVRDVPSIGALYVPDGSMSIEIAGSETVGPFEGREAIVDFISTAMRDLDDQRRHVITNLRVESESEDAVTFTAFLTLVIIKDGDLVLQTTGVYHADAERADGTWLLRKMHLSLDRGY